MIRPAAPPGVPFAALVAVALTLVGAAGRANADVIYVDANLAAGLNNGSSWANAYRGAGGLQSALAASVSGDEIWVADGRYTPGSARTSTFALKAGVAIYGGFAGGETALDQRNPVANIALLSGDLNNNDGPHPSGWAENAYHVVSSTLPNFDAVLDGFTITRGYANGTGPNQNRAGAVLCVGTYADLRNLVVTANHAVIAGGVGVTNGGPRLFDCRFTSNRADFAGGACAFDSVATLISRCWFLDNSAARAGGIDIAGSELYFLNCVLARNNASGPGGGGAACIQSGADVDLVNCTVYANTANVAGGGLLSAASTVDVRNTIVYANSTGAGQVTVGQQLAGANYNVSYSCVQHGYFGAMAIDPGLMDAPGEDYRPFAGSPIIDAGNNILAALEPADITGSPRYVDDPDTKDTGSGDGPIVDIGAHEYQGSGTPDCPEITQHPSGALDLCTGDDVWLFAGASGGGITGYQWRKDGVDIPGATSDTLPLLDVTNSDDGLYTLVVFDASCKPLETTSAPVSVCATDLDCNGVINSTDVGQFINRYFADQASGTLVADFDENGVSNSVDVGEFINTWFAETSIGCAG